MLGVGEDACCCFLLLLLLLPLPDPAPSQDMVPVLEPFRAEGLAESEDWPLLSAEELVLQKQGCLYINAGTITTWEG